MLAEQTMPVPFFPFFLLAPGAGVETVAGGVMLYSARLFFKLRAKPTTMNATAIDEA